MQRLLFVLDPMGGSTSVQFEILRSLSEGLYPNFRIAAFAPYCGSAQRRDLTRLGIELLVPPSAQFVANRLFGAAGRCNEATLWGESWVRETLFGTNSAEAFRTLGSQTFDYVINLSMTVPVPSDLWWIQGTPLDLTVAGMAKTNYVAKLTDVVGRRALASLDAALTARFCHQSSHVIANSPFLRDLYRQRNVAVEDTLYTVGDFSGFAPTTETPSRDFVLMYIGKETDPIDLRSLREHGVKVVGFGSKIPWAARMRRLTEWIDFRGRVTREELVQLYSNAMFTLFPFTLEPLGWVPIESMACGTPVLTYGRQGPAATVEPGKTGWLVDSSSELVWMARGLWRQGSTGIRAEDCVARARQFTSTRTVAQLRRWIEDPLGNWTFARPGTRVGRSALGEAAAAFEDPVPRPAWDLSG